MLQRLINKKCLVQCLAKQILAIAVINSNIIQIKIVRQQKKWNLNETLFYYYIFASPATCQHSSLIEPSLFHQP